MKLTTFAQALVATILLLAFWKPLAALWSRIAGSGALPDLTAIDVMVFIALALLAMRVLHSKRPTPQMHKEDR